MSANECKRHFFDSQSQFFLLPGLPGNAPYIFQTYHAQVCIELKSLIPGIQ